MACGAATRSRQCSIRPSATRQDMRSGKRDFKGASGLFSVVLKPCSNTAADAFPDRLSLFGMGLELGRLREPRDNLQAAAHRLPAWTAPGPFLSLPHRAGEP